MASKVIYKGVVYGDGVKQVELNTTIKDPLEMDLTPEQIAGEEPLDVRSSYDERNAKLTLNMDIPTALVIANGVVVTDDQKEKYVYTESEELEGVVTDKGYKLTYGTLGQKFVWNGIRVLFGRTNVDSEIYQTTAVQSNSISTKYYTEQGENINTVQYTANSWDNTESWPVIDCYQAPGSAWNSTLYSDEECTQPITDTTDKYCRVLNQNRILIYHYGYPNNGFAYVASTVNLISPGDNVTERTRVTPADRAAIAAGNNAVEKQYIFNFITKDDLYDSIPFSSVKDGSGLERTDVGINDSMLSSLNIQKKTADYTYYALRTVGGERVSSIIKIPSTADTVGFFFWSQYWSSSGAGVGIGIAGFEGDDLVTFIPLPYAIGHAYNYYGFPIYVWSNGVKCTGYAPWRTYYQFTPSEIIEGTYVSENQFTTTGGTILAPADVNNQAILHDTTTFTYYGKRDNDYFKPIEVVMINNTGEVLCTSMGEVNTIALTVLSGENSPEYKYAAGVTAKLSYVSKAQWEKASGHDIDDGE